MICFHLNPNRVGQSRVTPTNSAMNTAAIRLVKRANGSFPGPMIQGYGGVVDNLIRSDRFSKDITHLFFTHYHSDHMKDYARQVHTACYEGGAQIKCGRPLCKLWLGIANFRRLFWSVAVHSGKHCCEGNDVDQHDRFIVPKRPTKSSRRVAPKYLEFKTAGWGESVCLPEVFLATPAGLEPATSCLEGRCSIQLS